MWQYEKKLEYPIHIKRPDPRMAKWIVAQYGGPGRGYYSVVRDTENNTEGSDWFER